MNIFKRISRAIAPKKEEKRDNIEPTEKLSIEQKDGVFSMVFGGHIIFEHSPNCPFIEVFRGEVKSESLEIKKNLRKVISIEKMTYKEVKDGFDIEFNDKGYKLMVFARKKAKTLNFTFDGKVNYEYIKFNFYKNNEEILVGLGEQCDGDLNGKIIQNIPFLPKRTLKQLLKGERVQLQNRVIDNTIFGNRSILMQFDTKFAEYNTKKSLEVSFIERPQQITFFVGDFEEIFRAAAEKNSCSLSFKNKLSEGAVQITSPKDAAKYLAFYKENELPLAALIVNAANKDEIKDIKRAADDPRIEVFATITINQPPDGGSIEAEFIEVARALYQHADGFLCQTGNITDINTMHGFFGEYLSLIERELSEKTVITCGIGKQAFAKYPVIAANDAVLSSAQIYYNLLKNMAINGGIAAIPVGFKGLSFSPTANNTFKKIISLATMLPLFVFADCGVHVLKSNLDHIKASLAARTDRINLIAKNISTAQKGIPQLFERDGICYIGGETYDFDLQTVGEG